jgi:predicted helicase
MGKKAVGDAFELLCKYYFKFHPKNEHLNRDHVWLLNEIPERIKQELGLGEDVGFDMLLEDKQGNYIPVQCKYHSDPRKNLSWEEASTFFGKYYSNNNYQQAYLCTSAYGVSRHYEDAKTKPVIRVMGSDFQSLDKDFFDAVRCELEGKKHSYEPYKPRAHQEKAIKDAKKHFLKDRNSRGKLIFPCGSGKSLTGFWLAQELKAESIVVAVPSLSLVKQTLNVYLREIVANKKSVEWLCICSEADIGTSAEVKFEIAEVGVPCTTNPDAIKQWLERTKGSKRIIFTTYQSGRLIGQISKALGQSFDLGIFDEAHKTVGSTSKLFSYLLFEENISIHKRVFMTATERFYSGSKDDIVSMDDADIYGEVFTHMSFKDAIEQNLLTDYKVITIDVSKAEIAGFIRDNKLVELSKEFGKEAEARSLASMLALRKAMKRFGIRNAVSFHSSIRKAKNASQIQDYITKHYDFRSIDSYTVDGGMSTGKRQVIINEFAASPKALITNAKCLTEGVDVPNIDCIVFADPRRSKIDIVQALGRALRKKEGKDWGYVILPVVYDGDSHEIDNDNFKEILSIIRGLAANDERIIELFEDKQNKDASFGGGLTSEQFNFLTEALEESALNNHLGIKIWEGLSRFKWLPFAEARAIVHELKLENQQAWLDYCKSSHRHPRIPATPYQVYSASGWCGYKDWLNNGKAFCSFSKAKTIVIGYNIKTQKSYEKAHLSGLLPKELPPRPYYTYEKEWKGWQDFLGPKWLPYKNVKKLASKLGLNSNIEYQHAVRSGFLPTGCPASPQVVYKEEWEGWGIFLHTQKRPFQKRNLPSSIKEKEFLKLSYFVQQQGFKGQVAYRRRYKDFESPRLPSSPQVTYAEFWVSWGHFLGKNTFRRRQH